MSAILYHSFTQRPATATTPAAECNLEASTQRELVRMYVSLEMYEDAYYHQALTSVYEFAAHAFMYPYHLLPETKRAKDAPDDV